MVPAHARRPGPPRVYPSGGADFNDARPENAEADYETLLTELAASRKAVATVGLDEEFTIPMWEGRRASVRWLYLHMIEEYARHDGHADLLREQVDGTTGL